MIRFARALGMALLLSTPSLASPPSPEILVERARVALAEERLLEARALAREAVQSAPDSWEAHRLYLKASYRAGLEGQVRAEVAKPERHPLGPEAGALAQRVAAWVFDAETSQAASGDPEVDALLEAKVALDRGDPHGALALLEDRADPDAMVVSVFALREAGQARHAAVLAKQALKADPDRVEVALGLWGSGEVPGVLKRARKFAVGLATSHGASSGDPLVTYRARRVQLRARKLGATGQLTTRLVDLGEPEPVLVRPAWNTRMRIEMGRALSMRSDPALPPGTESELLDITTHISAALQFSGRDDAALTAWRTLYDTQPSFDAALELGRLLAAHGDHEGALPVLRDAVGRAVDPRPDDAAATDIVSRAQSTAAALYALAAVEAAVEDPAAWRHATEAALLTGRHDYVALRASLSDSAPVDPVDPPDWAEGEDSDTRPGQGNTVQWWISQAQRALAGEDLQGALGYALGAQDAACPPGEDLVACGSLTAEALAIEATALRGMDDERGALSALDRATLLVPRQSWMALRGVLLEGEGHTEAAFASYAVAGAGEVDAEVLLRTYGGTGDPVVAANVAASIHRRAVLELERMPPPALPDAALDQAFTGTVGEPMPAFSVDVDDTALESSELAGSAVVISFWASWCGPCMQEIPEVDALIGQLVDEGLDVRGIAISVDDRQRDYLRYRARSNVEHVVLTWSPDLGQTFTVKGIPATWVFDPAGNLTYRHVGYGDGAAAEIEAALRQAASPPGNEE